MADQFRLMQPVTIMELPLHCSGCCVWPGQERLFCLKPVSCDWCSVSLSLSLRWTCNLWNLYVAMFCSRHSSAEIRRHFSGTHAFHHSRSNSNASSTGYLSVVSSLLFYLICFCLFGSIIFPLGGIFPSHTIQDMIHYSHYWYKMAIVIEFWAMCQLLTCDASVLLHLNEVVTELFRFCSHNFLQKKVVSSFGILFIAVNIWLSVMAALKKA